jgi:hypothetical protein
MRTFLLATSFLLLTGASVAPVHAQSSVSIAPESGVVATAPAAPALSSVTAPQVVAPSVAALANDALPVVSEAIPLSLDESAALQGDGFWKMLKKALKYVAAIAIAVFGSYNTSGGYGVTIPLQSNDDSNPKTIQSYDGGYQPIMEAPYVWGSDGA